MTDNRNHDRDWLKHVEIIKPPFARFMEKTSGAYNPFPAWVGEACVGLIFDPANITPDEKRISILPDDWMLALLRQEPQPLSCMAGLWMHHNVFWGGPICTPLENVKILGKGRLLERATQHSYLPTIHMKIKHVGSHSEFDGDGIDDVWDYEILELIGRKLPPIEYEHAPLPFDAERVDMGMVKWQVVHEVGDVISEHTVKALKGMEVEVSSF